ncbi:MAG: cobalamin-binding protein [Candidatus Thermoplasmatota archaeon]|nr:cobalamin-binding protein [Candidatus Thermoplasmatota archaeon]
MKERNGVMMTSSMIIVVAVVISAVASFSGGYYLGTMNDEEFIEEADGLTSIELDDVGNVVSLTITDDYNRTITLPGIPQRIVSIAPTTTEILFAVGAGDQVVGVDDYSDYPAEALTKTRVGSFQLSIETILSLEPDLIVCGDLVPVDDLEPLEVQGIPYFVFATRTIDAVLKDIALAGILTGHVQESEALLDGLRARIDAITEKTLDSSVETPKVYVEYYPLWTYGPGSFGDDLIRLAGGINIAANTTSEYPEVTSEFVISSDPDVIIFTLGAMTTTTADEISERPGWDQITAIADDAIYSIDDNIVSRYGPRIVDGLEQLAELIHPELFE